ncbi:MAG TPA: DUF4395 domain-containing protein [Myxococcales bacterium]|jgi:hypothetical protein
MSVECPVSFETVDEKSARGVALVVVAATALFIATPFKWIAAILAVDFFLRAFVTPKVSPLALGVRSLLRALRVAPKPTDAAPKRFAAGLGMVFSTSALGLWLAGLPTGALVVASVLAACATLEGAFGFCLGCWVYTLLKPLLAQKASPTS